MATSVASLAGCSATSLPKLHRRAVTMPSAASSLCSYRSAFAGQSRSLAQQQLQRRPAVQVAARAYVREYTDPEFRKEVLEAFPEKGVATVEEARVLFDNGYLYLDVRPTLEYNEAGRVRKSTNIPIVHGWREWNEEQRKKIYMKEDNEDFVADVERMFPDKETPLLVACSDGRTYTMDALMALDEAGYTNLVGLKGGFYAWFRTFDNNLRRRRTGEYAETYTHDGDSCGIHSSGAGFERVDAVERWQPPVFE